MNELENYADDGTWIGIIGDITEDALETCVPMSVIIVFLLAYLGREAVGAWRLALGTVVGVQFRFTP